MIYSGKINNFVRVVCLSTDLCKLKMSGSVLHIMTWKRLLAFFKVVMNNHSVLMRIGKNFQENLSYIFHTILCCRICMVHCCRAVYEQITDIGRCQKCSILLHLHTKLSHLIILNVRKICYNIATVNQPSVAESKFSAHHL